MAILTISREYGSGGREIGHAVAKLMGYTYVNKEDILSDIRRDGPKWEQSVKDLDEHCPSVWEGTIGRFGVLPRSSEPFTGACSQTTW
jgi:hypothetical protein